MNILLLGCNGLIGNRLSKFLKNNHHNVYDVARTNAKINIDFLSPLTSENRIQLINLKIDAIIFTIYKVPIDKKEDTYHLLQDNLTITSSLVNIINLTKPATVVNLSSIAVYPNMSGNYSENFAPNPAVNWNCFYGLSKLCTEQILSNLSLQTKINIVHLRIAQLIDEEGNDALQKSFAQELKKKNTITVFANGERESNFIQLNDLCKIVEKVMMKNLSGIYNTGKIQMNYLDFAKQYIKKHGNKQSKINIISEGYKTKVIIDCSKLKEALKN